MTSTWKGRSKISPGIATHFHALADNIRQAVFLVSQVVEKDDTIIRTFRIIRERPHGSSFARETARKYGVTYDELKRQVMSRE